MDGNVQNWRTAFEHENIWGLKETQRHLWESLGENDTVIFYVTKPVGGVIGYGFIRTKFKQTRPLWSQELREGRVVWPLRFEFDVGFCLSPDKWTDDRVVSKQLWPRAGFQLLSQDMAESLLSALESIAGDTSATTSKQMQQLVAEESPGYKASTQEAKQTISSHEYVQEKLVEVGRLQKYIAEKEYSFDMGRLDVVWRRVANSVPTYVFEVQIGGDVYHALAKLKHALDLWNSHIFIVTSEKDREKANSLLCGTFHEINERIKFIGLETVDELYQRKKAYFDLERELVI
ncbi:hypothetical protein ACFLWM_01355 [Chloroflexota bacterium]